MSMIRLPSWREVLDGPWALRLRSGPTGAWLMRGEAENVPDLHCRVVSGIAAQTTADALSEVGDGLEVDAPLEAWDELPSAVSDEHPRALLVVDVDRLLADEPEQLATLLAALRTTADRVQLRVIFQARELTPDAEAVLSEFGVAEIAA